MGPELTRTGIAFRTPRPVRRSVTATAVAAARLIVDQRHLAENTVRPKLRNGLLPDLEFRTWPLLTTKVPRLVAFLKNNAAGLDDAHQYVPSLR